MAAPDSAGRDGTKPRLDDDPERVRETDSAGGDIAAAAAVEADAPSDGGTKKKARIERDGGTKKKARIERGAGSDGRKYECAFNIISQIVGSRPLALKTCH